MDGEVQDPRVDLALKRTEWALERTQLAWVRTAFVIMTTGLTLDKGITALAQAQLLEGKQWVFGGHVGRRALGNGCIGTACDGHGRLRPERP